MADRKITELTALSAGGQATGDLLTIVDVSEVAAADKNKKITMENLFKGIPSNVGIGITSPGGTLDVKAASATHPLIVQGPSSEFARFDSLGRLLVGRSAYQSAGDSFNFENLIYVENAGSSGLQTFVGIVNRNDPFGAAIVLGKTRGTSVGSNTIVQDDDTLGSIKFVGADGVDRSPVAAAIDCQVDGTPGSNDMPGSLIFSVTQDGNQAPTHAMRIKSSRILNFVNTPVYTDNAAAKSGGLVDGDVYRKSDGTLMIVYT